MRDKCGEIGYDDIYYNENIKFIDEGVYVGVLQYRGDYNG